MTAQKLEYTGERMVPEAADTGTFWEHIYRYRFASRHAVGKRVLDIACGEGYGSASLVAAGAKSVIGVDISPDTVRHAREKYGIDAREGRGEAIPTENASVDLIVSFETIEHIPQPKAFIDECARVLAPGGTIIISTPDVAVYSDEGHHNPFHCSEMSVAQFVQLLETQFTVKETFYQAMDNAPRWTLDSVRGIRSVWKHVRGYSRLLSLMQRLFTPTLALNTTSLTQAQVGDLIRAPDHRFDSLFNPYALRPACSISRGAAYRYVIAVCERRDDRP